MLVRDLTVALALCSVVRTKTATQGSVKALNVFHPRDVSTIHAIHDLKSIPLTNDRARVLLAEPGRAR